MFRTVKQFVHRRLLDDATEIHHGNLVAHLRDNAKIVRDEHDGHADVLLQFAHDIKDLGLGGHIKCGRWLIGKQQVRLTREREGDHGTLTHPTGQLVRKGRHQPRGRWQSDP